MAVIPPAITQLQTLYGHVWAVVWTPITNADTCGPIQLSGAADRSMQVFGTFGASSCAVQGSNEVSNDSAAITHFVALHDGQGNTIAMTTPDKIIAVAEVTNWIKPVVTGGDGTQTLTVSMVCRGY